MVGMKSMTNLPFARTALRRELHRRAWNATERTEYTAMPGRRAKHRTTGLALMKVDASIQRHNFLAHCATGRASQLRAENRNRRGAHVASHFSTFVRVRLN